MPATHVASTMSTARREPDALQKNAGNWVTDSTTVDRTSGVSVDRIVRCRIPRCRSARSSCFGRCWTSDSPCGSFYRPERPPEQSQKLPKSLQELRRAIIQQAIRRTIRLTASLPVGVQRSGIRGFVAAAGTIPALRRRVRDNLRLALGDNVPGVAARDFFRRIGWLYASQLAVFHHGLHDTPVVNEIKLDRSVEVLDEAVAEGRGVVLCTPHFIGYELMMTVAARHHPLTIMARQAPTPERVARKARWYSALGVEPLLRPAQASTVRDAVAYLKIFKAGKILLITPDLLGDPGEGVDVSIFGRRATLKSGAFSLAVMANAPMVRLSPAWQSDSSVVLSFERAPPPDQTDRDAAIRACAQDWCRWFERQLRAHPETWMFWLDKRWSRFLRETPRTET